MGCGQSKIGAIYSKNKKIKSNNAKKNNDFIRSPSIDQKNGNVKSNKTSNNGVEINRDEDESCRIDNTNMTKKKVGGCANGPLLHQAEVSSSQVDFFRMLDEKIENGRDYDESVDAKVGEKHATDLLRRWELSSTIWPNVNELKTMSNANMTNPVMTSNALDESRERGISGKDGDGMRNIIGERSEKVAILTRNANRVDGFEDMNCSSGDMCRNVLESITQSPIQSVRNIRSLEKCSMVACGYNDYIHDKNSMVVNEISADILKSESPQRNSDGVVGVVNEDDYVNPQALYREQYLQQSGIICRQPQYHSVNVIHNNCYGENYEITEVNNRQNFETDTQRGNFNIVETT